MHLLQGQAENVVALGIRPIAKRFCMDGCCCKSHPVRIKEHKYGGDVTCNVIYDTEVQKKNTGNLPKRSRYYQSVIDSKLLNPGVIDFNELNDVFIIIIAPFDLFGEERYVYSFSMQCEEVNGLKLRDGATRIFLNTHGKDDENITPELKELLYFMEHTNDPGLVIQSDNVRKLHDSVRAIQKNEEIGVRYMQLWEEKIMGEQEARAEGRAEGRKEGRKEGRVEGRAEGCKEGARNATMDNIRNLMDSLKLSLEQAMDVLKIPVAEREEYQTMI